MMTNYTQRFVSMQHDNKTINGWHETPYEKEKVVFGDFPIELERNIFIYEVYCERGTTLQYSDDNFSLIVVSDTELTQKSAEIILKKELQGYHVVGLWYLEDLGLLDDNVIYINNGN